MFQFLSKKQGDKTKGFTLIELLVVIAIIGVLASIVLASLNTARRKSRDSRRITDIKQIQLALELFFDAQTTQAYPVATATCDATNARGLQVLAPTYIPVVPRDPSASPNCYLYASRPTPITSYHIAATLEESTNPAFNSDRDCNSSIITAGSCDTVAYTQGFDGTPSTVYDLTP